MAELKVKIREKRAYSDQTVIVCGNDDYVVAFDWDEEWDVLTPMMIVVCQDGTAFPPIAVDNKKAKLPSLNTQTVAIGLVSGDTRTTTAAVFRCLGGVQDGVTGMVEVSPDFYDMLLERLEITSTEKFKPVITADKVGKTTTIKSDGENIANIEDGADGKDGRTPTKGKDYWTEEDKQEILDELDSSVLPAVTEADNGKVMKVVNGKWEPVESSGGSVYLTTVSGSLAQELDTLVSFSLHPYNNEDHTLLYGYFGLTLQFLTSEPITEWTTDLFTLNQPIGIHSIPIGLATSAAYSGFSDNATVYSAYWDGEKMTMSYSAMSPIEGFDLYMIGQLEITWKDFATWVSRSKVCVQKVG